VRTTVEKHWASICEQNSYDSHTHTHTHTHTRINTQTHTYSTCWAYAFRPAGACKSSESCTVHCNAYALPTYADACMSSDHSIHIYTTQYIAMLTPWRHMQMCVRAVTTQYTFTLNYTVHCNARHTLWRVTIHANACMAHKMTHSTCIAHKIMHCTTVH